jgi:hypothetical protein
VPPPPKTLATNPRSPIPLHTQDPANLASILLPDPFSPPLPPPTHPAAAKRANILLPGRRLAQCRTPPTWPTSWTAPPPMCAA